MINTYNNYIQIYNECNNDNYQLVQNNTIVVYSRFIFKKFDEQYVSFKWSRRIFLISAPVTANFKME